MIKTLITLLVFSILPVTNAAIAKPTPVKTSPAIIYGKPFYPSDYTPEMMTPAVNSVQLNLGDFSYGA